MTITQWTRWWNRKAKASKRSCPKASFRPRLETLEARCVLSADVVLAWNAVALNAEVVDHTPGAGVPGAGLGVNGGPVRSARALAIVQSAIYDAVNAVDGSYTPYLFDGKAKPGTSLEAAAAEAGHDTLVALYPQQTASFDAALAQSLQGIAPAARNKGIALGHAVAVEILAARQNDGNSVNNPYTPGTGPGQWRADPYHPTQTAYAPDYGEVKPFVILDGGQFQVPPPPALNSAAYATAYNEAKTLGGDGVTTPTTRTAEQTQIGIFWAYDGSPGLGVPPRLYNQIARVVAQQQHNTEVQNARLFALVNLALADAGITSWDTKYTYNFWRPVQAIHEADPSPTTNDVGAATPLLGDGNANTVADPNWRPLGAQASNPQLSATPNHPPTNFTPPFPAYTSGHATFGAALFRTLRDFYDKDNIPFSFTSDEFNGVTKDANGVTRPVVTRSFTSFSQAAEENGQSRIYLGIHWSFDKVQGIKQGREVADFVFGHFAKRVEDDGGDDRGGDGGGDRAASATSAPASKSNAVSASYDPSLLTPLSSIGSRTAQESTKPADKQKDSTPLVVTPVRPTTDDSTTASIGKPKAKPKVVDQGVASLDAWDSFGI